ncbi:MAG TPA: TraR/DksA family transcriptional regulator [Thermomicrobiales bacterium]|nr:TraR/DksA family transcriptional regulator [Thermomicrobiales bacterium]
MDATMLDGVRERLVARRDEIRAELDQMATEMQWLGEDQGDEGGLGNHIGDDGSNVAEAERIATISDNLKDVLVQVNGALQRLDQGTYGHCQRCGKPIAPERLEAFPYVMYDIDCQAAIERENAQRLGF